MYVCMYVTYRLQNCEFPIDASTLLSIMEQCSPMSYYLDVKQSTYKKMSKFITNMQKLGILKSKIGCGGSGFCKAKEGVLAIMYIDFNHSLLNHVKIDGNYMNIIKQKAKQREKQHAKGHHDKQDNTSSSSSSDSKHTVQIIYKYKPDNILRRYIFANIDEDMFDMKDAKQILWDYVKNNGLDNGSTVRLGEY